MMNAENVRSDKPLYAFRPIPCELDTMIEVFVREFMHAPLPERNQIVAAIPAEDGAFFISFAQRMATLAVRERSRERLLEGLVALIIEDFKEDWRDNIIRLAPLYDAGLKIDLEPQVLFNEAAAYFNNDPAIEIANFPARPAELKTLRAMGFRESSDNDGFKYERDY